jgi:hypothetical protein
MGDVGGWMGEWGQSVPLVFVTDRCASRVLAVLEVGLFGRKGHAKQ